MENNSTSESPKRKLAEKGIKDFNSILFLFKFLTFYVLKNMLSLCWRNYYWVILNLIQPNTKQHINK